MELENLIVDNGTTQGPQVFSPDPDGRVRLICPSCSHVRIVGRERFPEDGRIVRVKCVCGRNFSCRVIGQPDGEITTGGAVRESPHKAQPSGGGMIEVPCLASGEGPVKVECPYCESTRYVSRDRIESKRALVVQCGCGKSFLLRILGVAGEETQKQSLAKAEPVKATALKKEKAPADSASIAPLPPLASALDMLLEAKVAVKAAPSAKVGPGAGAKREPLVEVEAVLVAEDETWKDPESPAAIREAAAAAKSAPAAPVSVPPPARAMRALAEEGGGAAAPLGKVEEAAAPVRPEEGAKREWRMDNPDAGAGKRQDIRRFFADKQGMLHVACPACEQVKSVYTSEVNHIVQPAKVYCTCGHVFHCFLEFRRTYRKEVSLPGEYVSLKDKESGRMLVQDLSLEGIGFRTLDSHTLEVDDVVEVIFELDDRSRSEIRRQVRVRSVRGRFIVGAMFANLQYRDKALGFYLMP